MYAAVGKHSPLKGGERLLDRYHTETNGGPGRRPAMVPV